MHSPVPPAATGFPVVSCVRSLANLIVGLKKKLLRASGVAIELILIRGLERLVGFDDGSLCGSHVGMAL
ncbi:MAG: hypothetical protein WDN23_16920 [Edaphobacter sp.]